LISAITGGKSLGIFHLYVEFPFKFIPSLGFYLPKAKSNFYGLMPIASLLLISAMTGGKSTVVGITKWAPAW